MDYAIYAFETGRLIIADSQPEGALKLVSGEEKELINALNDLATLPPDCNGWIVPKNAAWFDALIADDEVAAEKAAYESMMNFRAYLERNLSRQPDQQDEMVECYFCQEPAPRGLILSISISPKFGSQEGKSIVVDSCPICGGAISLNVANCGE